MAVNLPKPTFVERDANAIVLAMIASFEAASGRKLYPAQIERLMVDMVAYRELLLRQAIQETAEQNLVAYATGTMLDHLGALLDVTRGSAVAPECTLRFTLVEPKAFDLVIPGGTRVRTLDGIVIFETYGNVTISKGDAYADCPSFCQTTGVQGNGYIPGRVADLVDPVPYVASVANLGTTTGGVDFESDDQFREKIRTAPYRFSIAGPSGAYVWHTKNVSKTICDVGVTTPTPGQVNIYPLTVEGPAPQALRLLIADALNNEAVRPLTDAVYVIAPTEVSFVVELNITVVRGSDASAVSAAVLGVIQNRCTEMRRKLGVDLVPEQWIGLAQAVDGVYKATVVTPALQVLAPNEWPNASEVKINVVGEVDG